MPSGYALTTICCTCIRVRYQAAKEEVEEQRQYALRVTADKGEELMATRATYKSEWDNAVCATTACIDCVLN